MKKIVGLLIGIVFICITISCSVKKVEQKEPLKIGVDVFPGWAHIFIAQEKGFFKKNGVDVEIVLSQSYLNIQNRFEINELDGAFMVYADAIYANGHGIDLSIVYISDQSIFGDVIVAKPGLLRVEDLRGKTIGVEGINSFSHVFVLLVLNKHGLEEGDYFIKNVDAQKIVGALERGEIDAGHTYGQGKIIAGEKGYSYLAFAGDVEGMITDVLGFHKKIIETRPDDVEAVIKSLFEAKKFQETNREEAIEIIAKAIGVTLEAVASGIDAVEYLDEHENVYAMHEEIEEEGKEIYSLVESGKLISNFYLNRGQLSALTNFDEVLEPIFVNKLASQKQEKK